MGQIWGDYLLLESYARRVNYQLAVLRLYCVFHHFPICSSIPFVDTNNIFVVLLTKERFTSVTTSVTIPSSMMHLLYERILINVWLSLARFLYPSLLLLCEQDKKVTKSYNFTSMSALPCGCERKKSPKTRDTKSKFFNPYICPCVIIFLSKFEHKSSSKHLISRPSLPHKNSTENWSSPRSTLQCGYCAVSASCLLLNEPRQRLLA